MTPSDKLAAIQQACIAANPEAYARGRSIPSIRLADVLLAMSKRKGADVFYGQTGSGGPLTKAETFKFTYGVVPMLLRDWNLYNDNLTAQSPECIDFLFELFPNPQP